MVREKVTMIGLGVGDGKEFIGIKPPLIIKEIDELIDEGLDPLSVKQIRRSPTHTLIDLGEVDAFPSQDFPIDSVSAVADVVGRIRGHLVKVNPEIVEISAGHSELIFEA